MASGEATRPRAYPTTDTPETPARLTLLGVSFAVALVSLLLFGWLARDVAAQATIPFDVGASEALHGLASPALDAVVRVLTVLGLFPVLGLMILAASVPLARRGRRREIALLVVALAGAVLLHYALKAAFNRPRPVLPWAEQDSTAAFPSGHAMDSLVAYLALACVIWQVWGARWGRIALVVTVPLVLLIGFSRVYLGLHFVSDVIGGYVAGLCWLGGVFAAFEGWRHRARLPRRIG